MPTIWKKDIIFQLLIIFSASIFLLTACNTFTPLETPQQTHLELQNAWKQPWHAIWELTWDESPLATPLIFEGWVTENRHQQRFEILEATNPKLVGLTYINDGNQAVQYNYFYEAIPTPLDAQTLLFSPITDAFNLVDALLKQPPQTIESDNLADKNAIVRLRLTYDNSQILTIWFRQATQHIIRLELESPTNKLVLAAREVERLDKVHPKLFTITN